VDAETLGHPGKPNLSYRSAVLSALVPAKNSGLFPLIYTPGQVDCRRSADGAEDSNLGYPG
jgi:hypothetical protein